MNELAQGIRPLAQGIGWSEGLADTEQFEVLRDLAGFCIQARATSEDGPESIRRAGIRPTYTPAVLVTRGRLTEQLKRIINLPQDERVKAFRLLVALLGVADDRRRFRFCAGGCGHAWHRLRTGAGTEPLTAAAPAELTPALAALKGARKAGSKAEAAFQRGLAARTQWVEKEGPRPAPRSTVVEITVDGEAEPVAVKLGV
ncbi:DUF5958 family protein [Streptomyces tendae]